MLAQGDNIVVKLSTRSVQYPFLLHLPAGQLLNVRGSFLLLDKLGDKLK